MATTIGFPLDHDHASVIRRLRQRLGAPEADGWWPHLTVAVAIRVPDGAALDAAVAEVAESWPLVVVRARGFGVFDDGHRGPVLHVPVVRTGSLSALHAELLRRLAGARASVDGHYRADSWFPHVTLWADTLTPSALAAAVHRLAVSPPIAWTLQLRELAHLDEARPPGPLPAWGPSALPSPVVPAQDP